MATPPASKLPRATPRLDAAALVIIAAGALSFALGFTGLARLGDGYSPSAALWAATEQARRDERLSFAGLALIAVGLVVGVVATVITHRRHAEMRRQQATAPAIG